MPSKLRKRLGLTVPLAALALVAALAVAGVPAVAQPIATTSASLAKSVRHALGLARSANKRSTMAIRLARKDAAQAGPQGKPGPKGDPGVQGEQGPKGDPGAQGVPGSALGYAFVDSTGKVDPAGSKNVAASNVTEPQTGFFCFHGLPFAPRNVVATPDYKHLINGQIPAVTSTVPGDHVDCGGASQAMVFTGLVEPGVFTKGADIGFYVVFN